MGNFQSRTPRQSPGDHPFLATASHKAVNCLQNGPHCLSFSIFSRVVYAGLESLPPKCGTTGIHYYAWFVECWGKSKEPRDPFTLGRHSVFELHIPNQNPDILWHPYSIGNLQKEPASRPKNCGDTTAGASMNLLPRTMVLKSPLGVK